MSLILPFKPFTVTEVKAVTGVPANMLDRLVELLSLLRIGDDGLSSGLDYMGTFAIYAGWRYLQEGASPHRALAVVRMLAHVSLEEVEKEIEGGRTFPVPETKGGNGLAAGCFVTAPRSRLGNTLNCHRLLEEFKVNLARVFPK